MTNVKPLFKRLLLLSFLVCFVVITAIPAGAASWNIWSQGDCASGYPKGASTLSWSGYSSSDSGSSGGWLWFWTGSSWSQRASGFGSASGSTNAAVANTVTAHQTGNWTQTGGHTATFFSGQKNSQGNIFSCP